MDKSTKIVVMGGVVAIGLISSQANAATACTTGTASSIVGAAGSFIKDTFTPKCSVGVTVSFLQDGSAIAVKSGSSKGMHTFGGSSEGGGVRQCQSSSIATPESSAATAPTTTNDGCST